MVFDCFKKDKTHSLLITLILFVLFANQVYVASQIIINGESANKIDNFLSKHYPSNEPGISIIIAKDENIILKKCFGMADLELKIPLQPEMIFRIGSVTKQFTAVAIMMLVEEEKLSLQDDITKFLSGFPQKGVKITIENLLTHTSGIKEFVGTEKWNKSKKKDLIVKEIMDLFKDEPLAFKPGEQWEYSDSGYVLLGAIIEKISGMAYGEFLHKRIFVPLDLKNTYCDSHSRLIPNRVKGYHLQGKQYINAPYISMTWTYAGGVLISSVDDLFKWDEAVTSGKLISKESLEKIETPVKLNNGQTHGYGYGWGISNLWGRKVIAHTGRIEGFTSYTMRIPEEKIYVAVLCNRFHRDPDLTYIAQWIATLLMGKITGEKIAVQPQRKDLDEYSGIYQIAENDFRTVTREGKRLFTMRTHGIISEAFCEERDKFFYKESLSYFIFNRDRTGKVTGMTLYFGTGEEKARKTDRKPSVRKVINLAPMVKRKYTGKYRMSFGDMYVILTGCILSVQLPGREPMEISPSSETDFFFKIKDAQIVFDKNNHGNIKGLVLIWGGRRMKGEKVE